MSNSQIIKFYLILLLLVTIGSIIIQRNFTTIEITPQPLVVVYQTLKVEFTHIDNTKDTVTIDVGNSGISLQDGNLKYWRQNKNGNCGNTTLACYVKSFTILNSEKKKIII